MTCNPIREFGGDFFPGLRHERRDAGAGGDLLLGEKVARPPAVFQSSADARRQRQTDSSVAEGEAALESELGAEEMIVRDAIDLRNADTQAETDGGEIGEIEIELSVSAGEGRD